MRGSTGFLPLANGRRVTCSVYLYRKYCAILALLYPGGCKSLPGNLSCLKSREIAEKGTEYALILRRGG